MTFGYRKIVVPPRFVVPPLPNCASKQPKHYEAAKQESRKQRNRLNQETVRKLDFHGAGGTVEGFRALLAHKHQGSAIRGWRKEFALDLKGTKPITWQEFCLGLKRLGFTGRAKELWTAISVKSGGLTASIGDLEPSILKHLDIVSRGLSDAFEGGAAEAWEHMEHEHAARATIGEFAQFVQEQEIIEDREDEVSLRRVFSVLDMEARGLITVEDLRFLDYWSQHRFGVKVPEPPQVELFEEEHWSPPPPKPPHVPDLADLRAHCEKKFGSPGRAWRAVVDAKAMGSVSLSDFGTGCRQMGFHHKFGDIYLELQQAGEGSVTLRAFDPATAEALDELVSLTEEHFGGDFYALWHHLLDPAGTGAVSQTEFLADIQDLGLEENHAQLAFLVLDTTTTGWLSVVEWGFVAEFAKYWAKPVDVYTPTLKDAKRMTLSLSEPLLIRRSSSKLDSCAGRAGGVGGAEAPSSSIDKQARGSTGLEVWRPTRAGQYRAYQNAHRAKHRWIKGVVKERVQIAMEPLPPVKRNPAQDIFRHSCDFYREGVRRFEEEQMMMEDEESEFGAEGDEYAEEEDQ